MRPYIEDAMSSHIAVCGSHNVGTHAMRQQAVGQIRNICNGRKIINL